MGQGYVFLVYENNKKFLVELLSMKMTQNKIVVYHAKEDADTLIVLTTISIVDKDGIPVIVVTQDTDILCFFATITPKIVSIFFYKLVVTISLTYHQYK